MIVDVLQENLLHALNKTSRIIPVKPQLPILNNVLLLVKNNQFTITSSNLETTEVVLIGAKTEKAGGICVPARLFTELVSSISPQTVNLSVKDNILMIKAGGVDAKIPGIDAAEFPPVSDVVIKTQEKLDRNLVADALTKVIFAAATDEGRPLLTGVKIVGEGDGLTLAATDGYRLAVNKVGFSLEKNINLVIPSKALNEVFKASNEDKDMSEVGLGQTQDEQLIFVIGSTQIITRAISGEYPNYEKIIPKTFTTKALVDKTNFGRAIKSVAIFAKDNANIVKILIADQKIVVSANTPQVGENKVEVSAKIEGDGGEIAFNSRFLLDFLNNFNEDELQFEMTGSLNPGVFKSVKNDGYLYVVMPVRIQG